MAAGREQSRGGEWGAGCGASIRWVSTIARACWTRKFVWQVACGKSIERGGGTKANAFRMLSSLNRQFRVQSPPPPSLSALAVSSCWLSSAVPSPAPVCLPACLPACLAVQPRANLLGTLFVAAAVDPNLQCFLSGPGHVCCACFHQLPSASSSSYSSISYCCSCCCSCSDYVSSWFVVRGTF